MSEATVGHRLEALDRALGVSFRDPELREASLTHRSFAFEHDLTITNERLEFLGDSVLGLVVTDLAYRMYPGMPEGDLAKLRAAIVNMTALADVARDLDLGAVVLLGKGEEQSGGRNKASILADALEAVFGAVYLDLGLDAARELIERLFEPRMEAYVRGEGDRDYKTILQELASQELHALPVYQIQDRGPDHQKEFTATVVIAGETLGTGVGRSKKEAEQQAAREAHARISERRAARPMGGAWMELPEVEVMRRDLERDVVGKKIKDVEVKGSKNAMRVIRRHKTRKDFASRLAGHKVMKTERRGKYVLLSLDGGEVWVVHFGMSGRFTRANGRIALAPHTHVIVTFQQGGDLRFVDPRTFGEMFVASTDELGKVKELQHIAIDPLDQVFTWPTFQYLLAQRATKMKQLMMDQKFISGLGNIYSDEVLFAAGIRYDRMSDSLSSQEVRRLYRAIQEILQDAIKARGTTLEDEAYLDLFGKPGEYQNELKVYGREGLPCRRCRTPIQTVKVQQRTSYFCPQCQS